MHLPPPVVALLAAVVQRWLTNDAEPPSPARATAAATTAATSVALAGAAAARFRRVRTTFDPAHPERASSLVTSGSNAITRNPMYVGMAGALSAHAVTRGSWRALIPVAGFVAVIDRLQIPPEEDALAARFGAEYAAYRARVPRWLGPVRAPTRR